MNLVANNIVATLMGSQFTTTQSNTPKLETKKDAFQNIFADAQKDQVRKSNDIDKGTSNKIDVDKSVDDKVVGEEKLKSEVDQEKIGSDLESNKTKDAKKSLEEIQEENDDELVELVEGQSLTESVLNERLEQMKAEILNCLSEMLGITPEELESTLTDMGMTAMDLFDTDSLTSLVTQFYGIDSFSELLTNEKASVVLKESKEMVAQMMSELSEELGIDVKSLNEMVEEMSEAPSNLVEFESLVKKVPEDAEAKETKESGDSDKGTTLKVVDDRTTVKETTESSQNQSDKGEQSFAELLSDNRAMTKEVTVVNSDQQIIYKEVNVTDVIDQIVTKAVVNLEDDKTTMQLQLNPENLGKIGVSVTSEQGILKGQFVAENQVVKEMLESNMVQLKAQLEEQGIKIEKLEVTVGNSNQFFEEQKQQQEQSNREKENRKRIQRLSKLSSIAEVVEGLSQDDEGQSTQRPNVMAENTVDYSA